MNIEHHPDSEQFNAYIVDPAASDYRDIRLHLMHCAECRTEVDMLMRLKDSQATLLDINNTNYVGVATGDELQLEKNLYANFAEISATGHNKDAYDIKAALHYASHSESMREGLKLDKNNPSSENKTGLTDFIQRLFTFKISAWLTVPVSAALASLLVLVWSPKLVTVGTDETVIAYQDNPVIQFKKTENLPGIGFFSAANKKTLPYKKINVLLQNDSVKINWPSIDNAESYTMSLSIFKQGKKHVVGKLTTVNPEAIFKRENADAGKRYVWHLNGKTRQGELFSTGGGFIINNGE